MRMELFIWILFFTFTKQLCVLSRVLNFLLLVLHCSQRALINGAQLTTRMISWLAPTVNTRASPPAWSPEQHSSRFPLCVFIRHQSRSRMHCYPTRLRCAMWCISCYENTIVLQLTKHAGAGTISSYFCNSMCFHFNDCVRSKIYTCDKSRD